MCNKEFGEYVPNKNKKNKNPLKLKFNFNSKIDSYWNFETNKRRIKAGVDLIAEKFIVIIISSWTLWSLLQTNNICL